MKRQPQVLSKLECKCENGTVSAHIAANDGIWAVVVHPARAGRSDHTVSVIYKDGGKLDTVA